MNDYMNDIWIIQNILFCTLKYMSPFCTLGISNPLIIYNVIRLYRLPNLLIKPVDKRDVDYIFKSRLTHFSFSEQSFYQDFSRLLTSYAGNVYISQKHFITYTIHMRNGVIQNTSSLITRFVIHFLDYSTMASNRNDI